MSVFDKLKAYSRKPAAVILATVMATSTIPTTPIAQAVTAAYAAEEQQQTNGKTATQSSKQSFDAKSVLSKDVPWDGASNLELTFSTHIDNGEAVATISADQVKALVKDQLENSEDFKNQFVYTKNGQDALSKQIDARLAEINKNGLPKDATSTSEDGKETTKTTYSDAEYNEKVALTPEVTGYKVELTNDSDGANSVAKVNGDGSITIKTDKEIDGTVNLKVTQISVKVGFGYKYKKTVDKTSASDSENSGSAGNNGGFSIEVGTVSGGNTSVSGNIGDNVAHTEETVDNDSKAVADVTLDSVTSGYGVGMGVVTGQLSAKEYYDQFAPVADIDATDLIYKTSHDPYEISLGKQGLTGTVQIADADAKYFAVEPPTSSADLTQKIQITPKKAFKGEKTFTIKWTYPNGKDDAGTTTVHVKGIAKKPIEADQLEINYQFYRFQDDQEKNVCDLLNQKVKDQLVDDADKAAVKKEDYFKSVSLDGYDETGANASVCKIVPGEENDKNDVYSNYEINCPTSVYIVPIESVNLEHWGDTTESGEKTADLTLTSYYGEDNHEWPITYENFGERYVKKLPVASWDGHTLSKDLVKDNFADTWKNDKDEEGSPVYPLYARNSKNGIITRVTVSYKYDHTAPTLKNITFDNDASVKKVPKDDILFTDQKSDVAYTLADELSGVDHDNVKTTYDDLKSGKTGIPAEPLNWDKSANRASFDIKGDREVPVDSISIHAVDAAGNVATLDRSDSEEVPEKVSKLVSNSSGVTVNVSYSDTTPQRTANGKGYYNHGRSVTFTVTDPFFKYTKKYEPQAICTITRDGADYTTVSLDQQGSGWKDLGNDTYSYTVDLSADGDYVIGQASFHDVIGGGVHTAFADGEEFVIDQTAPKLNVSWNTEAAQNGKYYNAARTATITVEEHNFDPNLFKIEAPVSAGNGDEATPAQIGGWSSNGDTHTATVTFPGQGVYTLSVSGEDLASNKSESYTSPEFVIDTIKPKIDIQNVVNRTAYAGEVAPSAAVHDTNLADGTTIEVSKISYPLSKDDPNPYAGAAINASATDKSVSYLNPAKTKGNDGVYTLTVQAIDLAGNTESEAVTWSVNRFGSTYVISDNTGKMLDQYLKSSKTTDVKVTEINPSGLDDNKTSVELTRDTKNTTLKSGDNYTTDSDTSSGWSEYNYTVNKSNYDKDGAYRVLFHSEDAAGNSSENTMEGKNAQKSGASAEINFAVDDTAPIASFVDLASNGKYEESSHKAKVSFEDNLKLSKAQIKVNGKTVATFTADQLEKSPIREFVLDGSSSKQDVTVVAWDAAGNKSKELKATGVLVTNDSFVLWMNNLPLMVGTIVAIVVVAGGIYMVVAKKRKENEEK